MTQLGLPLEFEICSQEKYFFPKSEVSLLKWQTWKIKILDKGYSSKFTNSSENYWKY